MSTEDKTEKVNVKGSESDRGSNERYKCPVFKGEETEFEDWRMKVQGWLYLTRKTVECPGLALLQALEGKALSVVRGLPMETMMAADGAKEMLGKLDAYYKKERVFEVNDKVVAWAECERMKGESVKEFILRFEGMVDECAKLGVTLLQGEAKGSFLLHKAKVTEDEKKMVMSACGMESLDYDRVRQVMKRLFEKTEPGVKEEAWYGRSFERGTEMRRDNTRWGGKNPMRNGVVSKCVVCSSEYHWARQCPRNMANRGRRGEAAVKKENDNVNVERSEDENASRVYVSNEEEVDYWAEVEGILDTGCKNSVIGQI